MGYGVWRDDELPAHRSFAEVIDERLRASKAVVVLWSADALKSEWVQSEADRARLEHKLVQVTIDGANPPMPFDRIQCVDLIAWRGDPNAAVWRRVVESVSELVGAAHEGEQRDLVGRPHTAGRLGLGHAGASADFKRTRIRWTAALVAGTVLIAIAAGGWWILARRSAPTELATPLVEVRAFSVIGDDPALRTLARGRAEAERTIREHPGEPGVGLAYATLLSIRQLQAPNDWVGAGARLDAAMKAAPEGRGALWLRVQLPRHGRARQRQP